MQAAGKKKLGFRTQRDRILHGYELRFLVRLAPTEYHKIQGEHRVFE